MSDDAAQAATHLLEEQNQEQEGEDDDSKKEYQYVHDPSPGPAAGVHMEPKHGETDEVQEEWDTVEQGDPSHDSEGTCQVDQ